MSEDVENSTERQQQIERGRLRVQVENAIKRHEEGDDSLLNELSEHIRLIEKDDPKVTKDCIAYASERLEVTRDDVTKAQIVDDEALKPGDLIRYKSMLNPHYAVVTAQGGSIHTTKVISKWGPSGDVYEHEVQAVLPDYGGETLEHLRV